MSVWWQFGASALVHALPSFASVPSVEMSPQWKSQHLNKVMKIVLTLQTLWKALRNPCPWGSTDHTLRTSALASFPHLDVPPSSALQRSHLQWALAALSSPLAALSGMSYFPKFSGLQLTISSLFFNNSNKNDCIPINVPHTVLRTENTVIKKTSKVLALIILIFSREKKRQ